MDCVSILLSKDSLKGKCRMKLQVIDQVMRAAACAHRLAAEIKEHTSMFPSLKSEHSGKTLQGGPSEAGKNWSPTEPERRVSVRFQQQA